MSPESSQSQELLFDCGDADSAQGSPQFRATATRPSHRGCAPPIDPFTGGDMNVRLEDWVPALERAAQWNGWTESEQLLQLAGHLLEKALQEWNLQAEERCLLRRTIEALKSRLDPDSQALAAREFHYLSQHDKECVSDDITRLEKTF